MAQFDNLTTRAGLKVQGDIHLTKASISEFSNLRPIVSSGPAQTLSITESGYYIIYPVKLSSDANASSSQISSSYINIAGSMTLKGYYGPVYLHFAKLRNDGTAYEIYCRYAKYGNTSSQKDFINYIAVDSPEIVCSHSLTGFGVAAARFIIDG